MSLMLPPNRITTVPIGEFVSILYDDITQVESYTNEEVCSKEPIQFWAHGKLVFRNNSRVAIIMIEDTSKDDNTGLIIPLGAIAGWNYLYPSVKERK